MNIADEFADFFTVHNLPLQLVRMSQVNDFALLSG
jgi:hypothetical protein